MKRPCALGESGRLWISQGTSLGPAKGSCSSVGKWTWQQKRGRVSRLLEASGGGVALNRKSSWTEFPSRESPAQPTRAPMRIRISIWLSATPRGFPSSVVTPIDTVQSTSSAFHLSASWAQTIGGEGGIRKREGGHSSPPVVGFQA